MDIDNNSKKIFLEGIKDLKKYGWFSMDDDLFSINIDERIELIKKYLFDNKLVENVNLRTDIICQLLRKNMSSQACDVKNFTEILDKLLEKNDKEYATKIIKAVVINDYLKNKEEIEEFFQKYIFPNDIKFEHDDVFDSIKQKYFKLGAGKELWQIIGSTEEEKESSIKNIIMKQNFSITGMKRVLKEFDLPKDIYDGFYKKLKKELFNQKINNAKDWLCDGYNWYKMAIAGMVLAGVTLVFGGTHHIARVIKGDIEYNQNRVSIEQNVEQGIDGQKFTHTAIIPVKEGDDYFVEIAGTLYNDNNKPYIFTAGYKIDKDLYDTIKKYFKVNWRFGENGQITNVGNTLRDDLELLGGAKARRAKWEVYERIETITKESVPQYTNIINNASSETEGEIE